MSWRRTDLSLNWSASMPIGLWNGITVFGAPPRVTELDASMTGLAGTIPADLGRLSELRSLDLSGNRLTGEIPAALAKLSNLQSLSATIGWWIP